MQAKNGHVVAVASSGGHFEKLLNQFSITHFHLDQTRKPVSILKAAYNYRRIVKEFRPDVVHGHMMTGAILARVLKFRTPYRIVTTVHNEFKKSSNAMKVGDRVIAVSNAVAQSLIQRGFDKTKVRVVLNGTLNSPRFEHANISPMQLHRPSIVTVAGLFYRKGIPDLLHAFDILHKEHPEAHLYIVGDGIDRQDFEIMANNLSSAKNIHFEGFQADPRRYLMSTDVFVLASHREPFGLVLIEARAAGCAIVATDVGGIPEALDDGAAGVLVPVGDSERLAKEISNFLSIQTN
jgi:glycosyltransferase involved in cell wall biosynthesis